MNFPDAFEAAFQMPYAIARACRDVAGSIARECTLSSKRTSLRARGLNVDADDLLDHWGHRHSGLVSARLSQASELDGDTADFQNLLEAARMAGTETPAPDLRDDNSIEVLGHRHGVTYGRWSGGPADTLSIEFDLQHAASEMRHDRSFSAALERAGKAWSRRIDDTWEEWERRAGESKGRLRRHWDGYFGTMEHAAFGTGFYQYDDWERQDGDIWDFYIRGTGFQGDISGTRPAGSAIWEGQMLGHQSGLAAGEDPFVQGRAQVSVSLRRNQVDIAFSGVKSMDRERSLSNFGYDDIPLKLDGTFDGFDEGPMEGAFFGPAHQEVAGMFHNSVNEVTGSFGAVNRD